MTIEYKNRNWIDLGPWTLLLGDCLSDPSFQDLANFLRREESAGKKICPAAAEVFRAFHETPPQATRVILLGQDPYHGPGQAHGLSFSVPPGIRLPPSLKNIFRELSSDLGCEPPHTGNLNHWSEQGVLLLNTVLTVGQGAALSHRAQGWETFTDQVIQRLSESSSRRLIFLLWGNPAQKKQALIDPRHHLICGPHPSPLSAYRGFFGSRPFSQINQTLQAWGEPPIEWIG